MAVLARFLGRKRRKCSGEPGQNDAADGDVLEKISMPTFLHNFHAETRFSKTAGKKRSPRPPAGPQALIFRSFVATSSHEKTPLH